MSIGRRRLVSKHSLSNCFQNTYGQVLAKTQTAILKNYCNVNADADTQIFKWLPVIASSFI